MIYISRSVLPPLKTYNKYLKKIWKSNWLTNNGELVQELEARLSQRFGIRNVVCVNSGTSAIILTLRAMDIKDTISVSPNNFIATVSAPVFMGIKPEFVDDNEEYDSPALVTHLYGIPNMTGAKTVIYDASHAFTTTLGDVPIVHYGDASIVSFNAVKIFQAVEGGAVFTNNDEIAEKVRWLRNFGFKTRYSFYGTGINCKLSEFHAAMGLCSLDLVDDTREKLDRIIEKYNEALGYNYSGVTYYPIYYKDEASLLRAIDLFESHYIYPRRYFYPPLNRVFGGKPCPIAEDKMSRTLCIPLYAQLKPKEIDSIIKLAKETLC